MKFEKSDEYNESDGSWWLTSVNAGPIEVVIKVQADKPVAKAVAKQRAMMELAVATAEADTVVDQFG